MKIKKWIFIFASSILLVACNQTQGNSNSSLSVSSGGTSTPSSSSSSSSSSSIGGSSGSSGGSDSSSSGQVVDPSKTIDEVIAEAVGKKDLLLKGTIQYQEQSYVTNEYTIEYEYGADDFFYFTEPDWSGQTQQFYLVYDHNNQVVPIQVSSDQTISKPFETFEQFGYRFDNVMGYDAVYFGVEDLLSGLYDVGAENINQDFSESYSEGKYHYSFGYIASPTSYDYYEIDVEFTIGTQNEFNWANVTSETYANTSFIYDDEYGVVQLLPGATPSSTYIYEISQQTGTRTKENPYSYDSLMASSFDLLYNEEAITDNQVIEMEVGHENAISMTIGNVLPATASFAFDSITSLVDNGSNPNVSVFFNSYSNSLEINAMVAGTYAITIQSTNVTKNFTIQVKEAQPRSLSVTYYQQSIEGYSADVLANQLTSYVNSPLYFQASVLPMEASQEVQINISGADNAYSIQDTTIQNSIGASINVKEVLFTNTGTYTITFTSTVSAQVSQSTTIQVVERPAMSEILTGEYGHKSTGTNFDYYITFVPTGDGMSGSATLEDRSLDAVENVTYVVTARQDGCYDVVFTHVDGSNLNFEVVLGPNYDMVLYIKVSDYVSNSYTLDKVTPALVISTTWEGTLSDGTMISFGFTKNGVVNVTAMNFNVDYYENFECFYSVTETDNGYAITFTKSSYTPETNTIISFDEQALVTTDYSNITVTVYCTGSAESVTLTAVLW